MERIEGESLARKLLRDPQYAIARTRMASRSARAIRSATTASVWPGGRQWHAVGADLACRWLSEDRRPARAWFRVQSQTVGARRSPFGTGSNFICRRGADWNAMRGGQSRIADRATACAPNFSLDPLMMKPEPSLPPAKARAQPAATGAPVAFGQADQPRLGSIPAPCRVSTAPPGLRRGSIDGGSLRGSTSKDQVS